MCLDIGATEDTQPPDKLPHPESIPRSMARHRKLLRAWLEEQLDMNTYPGVCWVHVPGAPPRSHFKIPWLHKAKPDWTPQHLALFTAWSAHTGHLKETDSVTTIKSRLRCALAKAPDVRHVQELQSREDDDCYRVYLFLPDYARKTHNNRPSYGHTGDSLSTRHASTVMPSTPMIGPQNQDDDDMQVQLVYGDPQVSSGPRTFSSTCAIKCDDGSNRDPNEMLIVPPPPDSGSDAGAADLARVCGLMQEGLHLEVDGGNIYATRLTQVHIFFTNFFHFQRSIKLERHQRALIYSMSTMTDHLANYPGDKIPTSTVLLSFGKRLYLSDVGYTAPVTAVVESMAAARQLQQYREANPPDDDLQISDSE